MKRSSLQKGVDKVMRLKVYESNKLECLSPPGLSHPDLMFTLKAGAYPSKSVFRFSTLTGANTLTYFAHSYVTKKKSFYNLFLFSTKLFTIVINVVSL